MDNFNTLKYHRVTIKGEEPYYSCNPEPTMYLALKMTIMANGNDFDKEKAEDTFADIAQMLKQKTGGQGYNKKDVPFENWERLVIEGLCHAVSLYLSGRLDMLTKKEVL